ncbi:MAG: DNA mismatch repair endonuclease MutL [Acidobacteriota bacterium]
MARIHILDDHLISQIAAGEVVERPSSVVKELVENSLDARASEVRVELESGGKRRITVTDDGIGMGADDALLAFDRHATSKIASFGDLEKIASLGFRGEALASIAAVSRVELRTAESAGDGHRVRVEGGAVRSVEPISHPRGTRLEIASLFYNVPARRKFLKKPQTELRRAIDVVQGYALAHPAVRFTLENEGRALLETLEASDDIEGLRRRLGQVFGQELAENLTEISLEFITDHEAITGFVGSRETTGSRRLFLYVNRRLIRDRILLARFYQAVRDVWHREDYPALFLFLEVEPAEVDVNVHPQKSEVRFRDPAFIDRVESALREALDRARREGSAPLNQPRSLPDLPATWEGLGGAREGQRYRWQSPAPSRIAEPAAPAPEQTAESFVGRPEEPPGDASSVERSVPAGQPPTPIARPSYRPIEPRSVPLSGRGKHLAPFRLLGQYKGSLILLEGHDGLYLVDQHAAHERILYERFREALFEREPVSQGLLEPLLLELSSSEAMRLEELTPALEACGFSISTLSGQVAALTAVPSVLKIERAESLVLRLASSGAGESAGGVEAVRLRLLEELAADMSCKAAVKIHRKMSVEEMEALVSELFDLEQPYACPHGRPTVLQMGDAELERRFGRR